MIDHPRRLHQNSSLLPKTNTHKLQQMNLANRVSVGGRRKQTPEYHLHPVQTVNFFISLQVMQWLHISLHMLHISEHTEKCCLLHETLTIGVRGGIAQHSWSLEDNNWDLMLGKGKDSF
jgi:hypothetical protein